jgi:protein ImuB
VALDPPDGLWIESAGSAHLFGGEPGLVADLIARLARKGLHVRLAIADTPGAAWAVARFGVDPIVAPGRMGEALAELPVAGLRLSAETIGALSRLGIERIGQLSAMPRAPLTRRFGPHLLERLDQALGRAGEALDILEGRGQPSPAGRPSPSRLGIRRILRASCAISLAIWSRLSSRTASERAASISSSTGSTG